MLDFTSPTSCNSKQARMVNRIQHDRMFSPSASVRARALKALREPTISLYTHFDVSHTEQDIRTAEERQATVQPPKTIQELMKNIIVFVDVRTDEDNRSAGVKKVISELGAKVKDRISRSVTHVIFKDGLLSTYKKAKFLNIPIVSILWVEACKNQRRICDPKDFPISSIDRYENPELYAKFKRHKSMQPDSEANQRPRLASKPATPRTRAQPKSMVQPTCETPRKSKKADIKRYLVPIHRNGREGESYFSCSPKSSRTTASTSQLLNGSPLKYCKEVVDGAEWEEVVSEDTRSSSESTHRLIHENLRKSLFPLQRSHDDAAMDISNNRVNATQMLNKDISTHEKMTSTMELVGLSNNILCTNTIYSADCMELTRAEIGVQTERNTTPQPALVTEELILSASAGDYEDKGALMPLSTLPQKSFDSSCLINTPNGNKTPSNSVGYIQEEEVVGELGFSSVRKPKSRRTIYESPMDIIVQRLENINRSARRSMVPFTNVNPVEQASAEQPINNKNKDIDQSQGDGPRKRRKLFIPEDGVLASPTPAVSSSANALRSTSSTTSTSSVKRRRTLAAGTKSLSEEQKSSNVSCNEKVTEVGPPCSPGRVHSTNMKNTPSVTTQSANTNEIKKQMLPHQPRMSYSNMHTHQVELLNKAVEKLGHFAVRKKVTVRTTHIVSPQSYRTLNMLWALVRGLWILDYAWVDDSLAAGRWLNEERYELRSFSRAVPICRSERQAFGSEYSCELFSALEPFYVHSCSSPIYKKDLRQLIRKCGGKVVKEPTEAKYILSDQYEIVAEKDPVSPYWIIDSITNMQVEKIALYKFT